MSKVSVCPQTPGGDPKAIRELARRLLRYGAMVQRTDFANAAGDAHVYGYNVVCLARDLGRAEADIAAAGYRVHAIAEDGGPKGARDKTQAPRRIILIERRGA